MGFMLYMQSGNLVKLKIFQIIYWPRGARSNAQLSGISLCLSVM